MEKWRVLSSEYLVNAPWAVLRKDVCSMPNGRLVPEYYVLEYPDWVNMVALTPESDIVLIKQYRHGTQEILLEIPAGTIEAGENPQDAAARELLEETGYTAGKITHLVDLYPNPATSNNKTTTFLMEGCIRTQDQNLDLQEEIEVQVLPLDRVISLLFQNRFPQALHASALFYALRHLGLINAKS